MGQLNTLKQQLGKPYYDLEFLLQCFKEVLEENEEFELANSTPWICESCTFDKLKFSRKHFHLFSVAFQMLNLVETNGAVQNRRKSEESDSLEAIKWALGQ